MDSTNSQSIIDVLSLTWELIKGILRLDPLTFETALNAPWATTTALIILFFASISNTLGHSVILFANRVRRRRFLLSLVIEALVLVLGAFLWATSIRFFAETLFSNSQSFDSVMTAVALGYAPLLFGFFILLPYLGNIIYQLLRIWVLLAVMVGISVIYDFNFSQVLVTSLLGWVFLVILTRIPFLRIQRLDDWLWRLATGTSKQMDAEEAVAEFMDSLDDNDPQGAEK